MCFLFEENLQLIDFTLEKKEEDAEDEKEMEEVDRRRTKKERKEICF